MWSGAVELAEGFDGVGVDAGGVLRATEVIPETLRMIRVKPHRPANPLDPLFGTPKPGEQLALLYYDKVAVRIEAQGAFLVINGLIVFVEVQLQRREYSMHIGIVVVERERRLQFVPNHLARWRPGFRTNRAATPDR